MTNRIFFKHQGNHAASLYPFGEPAAPRVWSYPCYYSPLDYSRMHMQPHIIQYPSTYSNCRASQRPIIANNDLVRSVLINGERGENNEKQEDKCL